MYGYDRVTEGRNGADDREDSSDNHQPAALGLTSFNREKYVLPCPKSVRQPATHTEVLVNTVPSQVE